MIKSVAHKGLERFYHDGSKAGIRPDHAAKLRRQLSLLEAATDVSVMDLPGWRLHRLTGAKAGHWSVRISGNWRLTFLFEGGNADLVDYVDYH